MTNTARQRNVTTELQHAEQALQAAQLLLRQHLLADAISRAYYGVFHATQALLFSIGLEAKSHHGVILLFDRHFVRPGTLPERWLHVVRRMQKMRLEADSLHVFAFTAEQVTTDLEEVQAYLAAIQQHLGVEK